LGEIGFVWREKLFFAGEGLELGIQAGQGYAGRGQPEYGGFGDFVEAAFGQVASKGAGAVHVEAETVMGVGGGVFFEVGGGNPLALLRRLSRMVLKRSRSSICIHSRLALWYVIIEFVPPVLRAEGRVWVEIFWRVKL
jgi:hypothetical protein